MDARLQFALLALSGIVITLLADMVLKSGRLGWGMVLYAAVAIPALYALRLRSFGSTLLLWETGYLLMSLVIASGWYHEPLTLKRAAAFLFAILAIVFSTEGR